MEKERRHIQRMQMEIKRCAWCGNDPLYQKYHDEEWGRPVYDDRLLFEMLILEGAQAGLSWITILKKRKNYQKAFDNFDIKTVAGYNDEKKEALLQNPGIVRNRLKINSAILNAQMSLNIIEEFGSLSNFFWGFVDQKPIVNEVTEFSKLQAKTNLSDFLSEDLKMRGLKFVGSTIIYSFMQAVGIVNDHEVSCLSYNQV